METTHGPLDIQLWCRECPATTKFFLQLCLDGFYDNMLFHRIVPSLLIQTGTMRSGDCALAVSAEDLAEYRNAVQADQALERRSYEVNARIRFNHRGQVAMALGVSDDENTEILQPQLFITTVDAPYLDGKHVIFGTLGAGPTIFNAIRICQHEVDEGTNTPMDLEHAPRILSTKIVENTVHESLAPQVKLPWRVGILGPKKKKMRKGKLDVNVLSFGNEMVDVTTVAANKKSIISRHDGVQSGFLSKLVDVLGEETASRQLNQSSNKIAIDNQQLTNDSEVVDAEREDSKPKAILSSQADEKDRFSKRTAEHHVQYEGNIAEDDAEVTTKERSTSLVDTRRAKYVKGRKSKQQREEETMAKLIAFREKIHKSVLPDAEPSSIRDDSLASRMARRAQQEEGKNEDLIDVVTYRGQILESDGEDETGNMWLSTRFKCRRHIDHRAGDGRDADDYKVIDDKSKRVDEHESRQKRHRKQSHKKGKEL